MPDASGKRSLKNRLDVGGKRMFSVSRRRFLGMTGAAVGALATGCASEAAQVAVSLPVYVDDGRGWPVFRGPYSQRDAQLAALLLPADVGALQTLCDTYFNTPADGAVEYVPFGPYVMLVYADMRIQSLDARDCELGGFRETEVGFWVPVRARRRVAGVGVVDHLAWFLPYIFVDNAYAIATGREVYGFSKTFGRFSRVEQIQKPEFSLDVWGSETGEADETGQLYPLLTVQALAKVVADASGVWSSWDAARSALIHWLFAAWSPPTGDAASWLHQLERMPLVFLKQFRDAAEADKACYQAIIEAPIALKTFYGGGMVPGEYAVRLHSLASHPLAEVLGLQTDARGVARTLSTFWLHLDFELALGTEVWRYGV